MAPRTTARKKPGLTRDMIIDRALAVVDEQGPDALTIRTVATDLGVTPMAMYWHFGGKEELLGALGDRILAQVELPDADADAELRTFLTTVMEGLAEAMRPHAALAHVAAAQMLQSEHGREVTERALVALEAAGLSVEAAAMTAHHCLSLIVTLVAAEPGAEPDVPRTEREAATAQKRMTLSALPVEQYPHIVAAADALTSCYDTSGYYEEAIESFVTGVCSRAGSA